MFENDEKDPNFEFMKKIYEIVTKHFFSKFAYRGGGGGGDSEWSAELLYGLKYDMIWLPIFVPCDKRKGRFLQGRSGGWSFLNQSFLRVSIRFGSTGEIYAILETI